MKSKKLQTILCFLSLLFGIELLLSILMYLYTKEYTSSPSHFVTAIMLLPAACAILTKMIMSKQKTINKFFQFYLLFFATYLIITVSSLFFVFDIMFITNIIIVIASLVAIYLISALPKKDLLNHGLYIRINAKKSVKCILLFIVLFSVMVRLEFFCDYLITNNLAQLQIPIARWLSLLTISANFVFVYIAFFGEEYGWRYYLWSQLSEAFGKYKALILLSTVEVCFHIPVDYIYNQLSKEEYISRILILTSSTIFFCWVYEYTHNIWTLIFIHHLNNSLGSLWSITDESLQFSSPLSIICYAIIFCPFVLSKLFKSTTIEKSKNNV